MSIHDRIVLWLIGGVDKNALNTIRTSLKVKLNTLQHEANRWHHLAFNAKKPKTYKTYHLEYRRTRKEIHKVEARIKHIDKELSQ